MYFTIVRIAETFSRLCHQKRGSWPEALQPLGRARKKVRRPEPSACPPTDNRVERLYRKAGRRGPSALQLRWGAPVDASATGLGRGVSSPLSKLLLSDLTLS